MRKQRILHRHITYKSRKYRSINEVKVNGISLNEILEDHNNWLSSERKFGTPANFNKADLEKVDLSNHNLSYCDFSFSTLKEANLTNTKFRYSHLVETYLSKVLLESTELFNADLRSADLSLASIIDVGFRGANLKNANFTGANLHNIDFSFASMINTIFRQATIIDCCAYGVSVWDCDFLMAFQSEISIMPSHKSAFYVDNLEISQFFNTFSHDNKIHTIIDSLTATCVLLLGNFSDEYKKQLNLIGEKLFSYNYIPIIFDFSAPNNRNLMETIKIFASISLFVIADISNAQSVAGELEAIVTNFRSLPVLPIIRKNMKPYGMFESFKNAENVLKLIRYDDIKKLLDNFESAILEPVTKKISELRQRRQLTR